MHAPHNAVWIIHKAAQRTVPGTATGPVFFRDTRVSCELHTRCAKSRLFWTLFPQPLLLFGQIW